MDQQNLDRLKEIYSEFEMLLDEAKRIVRHSGNNLAWERAKGYWIGHIATALSKNSDYLGSSMFTMEDTIDELESDLNPACEECGETMTERDQKLFEDGGAPEGEWPEVCEDCAEADVKP